MAIPEAAGCRHIPIAGGPSRRIGYARIRRRHVPPVQKAFIAWLRELCRQSR
jgi:DNA-binding transcriptional LysR family regulator